VTEVQQQELGEAAEEQIEAQEAEVQAIEEEPSEALAEDVLPEQVEEADELDTVRQELEEARAKESEYLDGWQRARAELANARKRFKREQEQAYGNARADLLVRLLPIMDDFERAFDSLPGNPSNQNWLDGVKLIQHKFLGLLEQEGVKPIEAEGGEFDPFLHQAVTHEPSEDVPEGHVIAEMQKGYTVGDRVLRPSVVRVSAGQPPEPGPEPEAELNTEEAAAEAEQS
jgi:molecular chaperone GrpE